MKKQAVLINAPEAVGFVEENFPEARFDYFALSYNVILAHPAKKIRYFYEASRGGNEEVDQIDHLARSWSRDERGRDLLFNKGFSLNPVIAPKLIYDMANDFRNYKNFKTLAGEYSRIFLSGRACPSLQNVARFFGDRIGRYETESDRDYPYTSSPTRIKIHDFPTVHPLSFALRTLQNPLLPLMRKRYRILYFKEGTSALAASRRKDFLTQNSKYFWKGAYYRLKKKYVRMAESVIPQTLDAALLTPERLALVLKRIGATWDRPLLELFASLVQNTFNENRKYIVRSYALYRELLERYRPEFIIVPTHIHFGYNTAMQIAREKGAKTIFMLDGYEPSVTYIPYFRDENNDRYLFDIVCCYGEAHTRLIAGRGFPKERLITMRAPILDLHQAGERREPVYDATILSYVPNVVNPHSRWDCIFKISYEIVTMLKEIGMQRIAIKVKSAGSFKQIQDTFKDHHATYHSELERRLLASGVDIVTGSFHEHIDDTKCVIGALSTAILETLYHDKPYFVYEPYENGFSDEIIGKGIIFRPESIARNLEQLKKLIVNKTPSIVVDKEMVVGGPHLADVKFS